MLQSFVQWLPDQVGGAALAVAMAGALVGAVLWISGARFSRTIIGLIAVAIGAVVGMKLPAWMGLGIGGEGPAVLLALLLGVIGYLMHRLWIGVALGIVLASWAFLATWVLLNGSANFNWPAAHTTGNIPDYLVLCWHALPVRIAGVLPIVCGGAMMFGLLITLCWPGFAIAAAWSAAGASLLAGLGSVAMEMGRPQWMKIMPQTPATQFLALIALVLTGVAAQWRSAQAAAGQLGPVIMKPTASGSKGKPAPRPTAEGAD
jgi:hypothetical protein